MHALAWAALVCFGFALAHFLKPLNFKFSTGSGGRQGQRILNPRSHVPMIAPTWQYSDMILVDVLIPLGPSCLAAYHFRRGGWRTASLPFDWTLFDDRQKHLQTLVQLVDEEFSQFLALENDKSQLQHETYMHDGHVNISVTHKSLPTIRWLHDDPLKNATTIVRRTRRLLHILKSNVKSKITFTLAYGGIGEVPSPLSFFLAQLHSLASRLEKMFPSIIGRFSLLVLVQTRRNDSRHRALLRQMRKMPRYGSIFRLQAIRPLAASTHQKANAEETRWGNYAAWDDLMRTKFRKYTSNNESLTTCLRRYSVTPYEHPQGVRGPFTRYGYFVCQEGKSKTIQNDFKKLDADQDGLISLQELADKVSREREMQL